MLVLRICCSKNALSHLGYYNQLNQLRQIRQFGITVKSMQSIRGSGIGQCEFLRLRELPVQISTRLSSFNRLSKVVRGQKDNFDRQKIKANRDTMFYVISLGVVATGFTFLAIPAYRMFCEATSFGGLTQVAKDFDKIAAMEKVQERMIRVQFSADVPSSMRWNFKPLQHEIFVHPGETALVFYSAKNPTDKPIVGISSYNLTPFNAAYYFNKIQCFCFEEQILNPGEEIELPVFFYIDPDYANDPSLEGMDSVLLSYTFFEAKSGLKLPSPFDPQNRPKLSVPFNQMSAST